METIKTSNMWAAAWAVYRGCEVVRFGRAGTGRLIVVELDDTEGKARAATREWQTSNPTAPIRALVDIHSDLLRGGRLQTA